MTISITKLYEILSIKIGKEPAENLTTFIEEKIKDEVENKSQMLATKADLHHAEALLREDIRKVDVKISDTKSDVIKWMFAFWVTLVLMMVGLYFKQ